MECYWKNYQNITMSIKDSFCAWHVSAHHIYILMVLSSNIVSNMMTWHPIWKFYLWSYSFPLGIDESDTGSHASHNIHTNNLKVVRCSELAHWSLSYFKFSVKTTLMGACHLCYNSLTNCQTIMCTFLQTISQFWHISWQSLRQVFLNVINKWDLSNSWKLSMPLKSHYTLPWHLTCYISPSEILIICSDKFW
jgi:hypothetical protein